ncbi:uncharacterized protein MONOS_17875 [Monocercomonoides exilis]|uniref:uncharacterized protein n=1 Tax=Monocercomonoides exilis TaxID=2049356 RepID=UPI00355A0508|nr:hypothetical protein MONOS_18421 [Monocercomonoides exilis]KAH7814773.1 hypothetical protein MONOS_18422 [Monocercomonoides exilis]KAH7815810.1 hypothetical protein MONOS_18285 [Monocercomonoides exilis]KAH7815854.1 hypothetical protein MONOS_18298 [Monocercomonoides exilis]KAH7819940.1 hypothetical protein MONOS_17871 [Monocercomonoides exilis]
MSRGLRECHEGDSFEERVRVMPGRGSGSGEHETGGVDNYNTRQEARRRRRKQLVLGEKKMKVVERGRTMSMIETNSLSSSSVTLFGVSCWPIDALHLESDRGATRSPSPSVLPVSLEEAAIR